MYYNIFFLINFSKQRVAKVLFVYTFIFVFDQHIYIIYLLVSGRNCVLWTCKFALNTVRSSKKEQKNQNI